MSEREKMTEAVWFRVESSRKERWQVASLKAGERDSDFYRRAIDALADEVLEKTRLAAQGEQTVS